MINPNPYPFGSGPLSGSEPASPSEVDFLLEHAGYRVRSSDLKHVAARLELLDSATQQGEGPSTDLASVGVHYNPSDLNSWVDSMLGIHDEEDTGICLVHLLMTTADAVQRGDSPLAASLISDMRLLLTRVNSRFGIGKVAGYFVDALTRRLCSNFHEPPSTEFEILYHHFYESSPFLKFAHFTANQAILEAFGGHDRVHVVDFNLMHGLQWPALIQALALRPGGPPFLRITGMGPPSPDGRDSLREVGLRLAELARSLHVRFAFRGVAASRLDDVKPWMLQVAEGEAVAVSSVLQLHKLLGDAGAAAEPVETVLNWIVGLKPKIVTVVEQEADHNKPVFLDRFTEALFYYSTVFDSLEMGRQQQGNSTAMAEAYLQREICNIVCCEGPSRFERHEPLTKWRARLSRVGLRPVHLGSNAYKQARMLLTLFSGEGYGVDEVDGCLTLGWHNRPLLSASAWRAATAGDDDADVDVANFNYNQNYNYNYNSNANGGVHSSSSRSNNGQGIGHK